LVKRHVRRGSTVLDFGCGTGLDALAYAQRGYRVLAYDNSPGMVAQLERRCQAQIASGDIAAHDMDYPSFLECFPRWPTASAVTANFAVLNSIRDLRPLFGAFARHLAPPGWMLVSILNPLHWSKLKMPGWWRSAWRVPRGPRLYATHPYASYLHFVPALLRAAQPFHLVGRANAGALVRYDAAMPPHQQPVWWEPGDSAAGRARALWRTPFYKLLGHFIFLVLRRDS
jgi:SAM-dependent methyltransferase